MERSFKVECENLGNMKFVDQEIERRKTSHRFRRLFPVIPLSATDVEVCGKRMLSFASNDYLGLSKHPKVKKRSIEYIECYGTGATASPLVCGNFSCAEALCLKLALMKGAERVLIFPSGFQANITLLPTLADGDSLIVSDQLNHASIVLGGRLARCAVSIFPHNDYNALEKTLRSAYGKFSRIIVVTESVFSMDGDIADIETLVNLTRRYSAFLIVDEAHATGVMGHGGMGLCAGQPVDVIMGTFSKALGASGAYVACSNKMADYLVNCCGGFIYSTGLSPAVIGAVDAALDLIPTMEGERKELHKKAQFLRERLVSMGFDTARSCTHIIPAIVGDEKETLELSDHLKNKGIFALAFRPPTVPPGTSRIRISLSAAHTWEDVETLVGAFESWTR